MDPPLTKLEDNQTKALQKPDQKPPQKTLNRVPRASHSLLSPLAHPSPKAPAYISFPSSIHPVLTPSRYRMPVANKKCAARAQTAHPVVAVAMPVWNVSLRSPPERRLSPAKLVWSMSPPAPVTHTHPFQADPQPRVARRRYQSDPGRNPEHTPRNRRPLAWDRPRHPSLSLNVLPGSVYPVALYSRRGIPTRLRNPKRLTYHRSEYPSRPSNTDNISSIHPTHP